MGIVVMVTRHAWCTSTALNMVHRPGTSAQALLVPASHLTSAVAANDYVYSSHYQREPAITGHTGVSSSDAFHY